MERYFTSRQPARGKRGKEVLQKLTFQTARSLFWLGLIPSVLIMILGPAVIEWIFGDKWQMTGIFVRWLMPWVWMTLLTVPLSFIMDVQRRLGFQLRYNIVLFLGRASVLVLGGIYLSATEVVIAYGAVGAAMGGLLAGLMLWLVSQKA